MAVTSDDIAEPVVFNDAGFGLCLKVAQAAHCGANLLEAVAGLFREAADGKLVLLAVVSNEEQKGVLDLMVKSARQALDLRSQIEAAVFQSVTQPAEVANEG